MKLIYVCNNGLCCKTVDLACDENAVQTVVTCPVCGDIMTINIEEEDYFGE